MSTKINMDFQIGDKVKWKVGKVECKGVFLQDDPNNNNDGMVAVITHYIGKRFSGMEQNVVKKQLKLDIEC